MSAHTPSRTQATSAQGIGQTEPGRGLNGHAKVLHDQRGAGKRKLRLRTTAKVPLNSARSAVQGEEDAEAGEEDAEAGEEGAKATPLPSRP